jgi:hypothetical protein
MEVLWDRSEVDQKMELKNQVRGVMDIRKADRKENKKARKLLNHH